MHSLSNASTTASLLGLILVSVAPQVRAQSSGPRVTIHVEPCVPVNRPQLERLLAVELSTSTGPATGPAAPTEVRVDCVADGIELQLRDGVTRKTMARVLPASSFTDASSTRLLALAVAEFIVASWVELEVRPQPVIEPVGPRPKADVVEAATRVAQTASRRTELEQPLDGSISAAVTGQAWSAHRGLLFGAQLRVLQLVAPPLAITLVGDFGTANVRVALGSVALSTTSGALALGFHFEAEELAVYAGPGVRVGVAYMRGDPDDTTRTVGKSFFAPYAGPLIWGRLEYRPTLRLRLALELEFGAVTVAARAFTLESRVLSLEGVWGTAGLAIGLGF